MTESTPDLVRRLYTAQAKARGGRTGTVRSPDGSLELSLGKPGSGKGTNPEQLLAAAWAACFQSTLEAIAGREGVLLGETSVQASVSLGNDSDGRWALEAVIEVNFEGPAEVDREALSAKAHDACPFSRMARGIPVTVVVS